MNNIKHNKGFFIIFLVYILMFILDMVTTLTNHELLPYIEVNYIYQTLGSLWPVILLNLIIIGIIYWVYTHKKTYPGSRYVIMTVMILTIFLRIIAVRNAIEWTQTDMSMQEIQATYTAEVREQSLKQLNLTAFLPMFLIFIPYIFWRFDHNVTRKDT